MKNYFVYLVLTIAMLFGALVQSFAEPSSTADSSGLANPAGLDPNFDYSLIPLPILSQHQNLATEN